MTFSLDNYTTVAERILQFYKDYPAGSISTTPAKIVEINGQWFISVIARVYLDRQAETFATEAEAWEPFPGKTPYTRDSEMMNSATSAIGRALMQLGIGITEAGAASRDEVQVAKERRQTPNDHAWKKHPAEKPASDRQVGAVKAVMRKRGITHEFQTAALSALLGRDCASPEDMFMGEVDHILKDGGERLMAAYMATMGITLENKAPDNDLWATGVRDE